TFQDIYYFFIQHINQSDQREADQGIGVPAFKSVKQADAQSFGFEAAGTVVGLFPGQIVLYLTFSELTKHHLVDLAAGLGGLGGAVKECQAGIKGYLSAARLA